MGERRRVFASTVMMVAAVIAMAATACTPIASVDFANFTYAPDTCGDVVPVPPTYGYELSDRSVIHGDPSERDFYSVTLRADVAYGDLTGDGLDEAALTFDCSAGNRPLPIGRVMTTDVSGATVLAPVPTPELSDEAFRIELLESQIDEGQLVTTWIVQRPGDAPCCPTGRLTTVDHWNGERFVTVTVTD